MIKVTENHIPAKQLASVFGGMASETLSKLLTAFESNQRSDPDVPPCRVQIATTTFKLVPDSPSCSLASQQVYASGLTTYLGRRH